MPTAPQLEDWQRPTLPLFHAAHAHQDDHFDLGEFLRHPDGTYQALEAGLKLPDYVTLLDAEDRTYAARVEVLGVRNPVPTRYAPQPSPQFITVTGWGSAKRSTGPAHPWRAL